MEVQQQEGEQKEQSQELSDENNISLLDMCQYSDMSSVEDENSPLSGQCKENKDKTMMNKMIMEIIFTILVITYFAVEVPSMESKEEILAQNLKQHNMVEVYHQCIEMNNNNNKIMKKNNKKKKNKKL